MYLPLKNFFFFIICIIYILTQYYYYYYFMILCNINVYFEAHLNQNSAVARGGLRG